MSTAPVVERRIEDLLRRVGATIDWVEADGLRDGLSPRVRGVDPLHVRRLADLAADLPPLVVQHGTMRVVDGAHRLAAARVRGLRQVPVVYFDGTDDEAFVVAVHLNAVHGKALRPRDRTAAVERILGSHPDWSDRWIASVCGVAPRTVAAARKGSAEPGHQLGAHRVGRDGRHRPLSTQEGRRRAEEIMREEPGVSLRQVARRAGLSVGTVLDVRRHLMAGAAGVTHPVESSSPADKRTGAPAPSVRDQLEWLAREPSLRYTDQGRALLRLVSATLEFLDRSGPVAGTVPGHCRQSLDMVARACAGGWLDFAEQL